MKFHRTASAAVAAVGSTTASSSSVSAFAPFLRQGSSCSNGITFLGRRSVAACGAGGVFRVAPATYAASVTTTTTATATTRATGLNMIFERLFGGGGGAFNSRIDYASLPHPGPELAEMAQAGIVPVTSTKDPNLAAATFAGGCFWGLELAYQRIPGVAHTAAGYTQGQENQPNYDQVCAGATGHTEAVMVYYDPAVVSYEQLLDCFFDRVNPLTVNGQGNDYGRQYRTGVYFHSDEQQMAARARFAVEQTKYTKTIATELAAAMPFWPAEARHQQYLERGGQNASKGAMETIRCYG